MYIYECLCVYVYIYIYMCVYIYMYTYISLYLAAFVEGPDIVVTPQ